MSKTIFEKIAGKEKDEFIIWEDERFIAFLTIQPYREGHTLVVPKKAWSNYVFDLDEDRYSELWLTAKKVAAILEEKIECDRIVTFVGGFEVPHVHIHLIPANKGFQFPKIPAPNASQEELERVHRLITG